MRGYPIDDWRTEDGFYSTYALAHILGWDFRYYIRFVGMIVNHLMQGPLGIRSPVVYATSRHRKIIGGWLFVDAETIDLLLQRRGWPTTADIFASLNLGVSPLDQLSEVFSEDRIIIDDFHRKSKDFLEYPRCILHRCQKVDRLFNKISGNRKKCQISVKMFCRLAIKHRRIEIHPMRWDLPRIFFDISRSSSCISGLRRSTRI